MSISRNRIGKCSGMWLSSRYSFSFQRTRSSPAWRRLATMWISPSWLASSTNRRTVSGSVITSRLERAMRFTRRESEDYRHYEERGDHKPIGTLDLVRDESVDEDDGDHPEHQHPCPSSPCAGRERNGKGGRAHHCQHACGVSPGLGVHVGPEMIVTIMEMAM